MRSFLAVIAKNSSVQKDLYTDIKLMAPYYLGFQPGTFQSEEWCSASKNICLFSWTNELPNDQNAKILQYNNDHACTISGYINSPQENLTGYLLDRRNSVSGRRRLISRTGGLYAICYADSKKETVSVWNTITRIVPVYWCENSKYIFAATKALLAHLLCENKTTPAYNLTGLVSFINTGYFNSEHSPYEGVNILPPNCELQINPQGVKIIEIDDFEEMQYCITPDAQFYDELASTLISCFSPVKEHQAKISCGLTGGKDTRLIVSVLKHLDISNVETHTSGFADHPDVVIAGRIASILNLPHSINSPEIMTENGEEYLTHDILKRTRDILFAADGILSAHYNISRSLIFNPDKIILGGHGGELVRSGFYKTRQPKADYANTFFNKKFMYFNQFLHDEFVQSYQSQILEWKSRQKDWLTALDLIDKYFLHFDVGRRSAAARSANSLCYYLYQPFFDAILVKLLLRIKTSYRLQDNVSYNLLKRFAPQLIDIPFFGEHWNFETERPEPDNALSQQKRTPLMLNNGAAARFNWKNTCLTDMKEAFYEQIFCSKASADIFTIVNKEKVQDLFNSSSHLQNNTRINHFLWNLYTCSVLLSNEWLQPTASAQIVKIRIPAADVTT